jgi:hypothetical protein
MALNSPRKASLSAFQTMPSLARTAATYTMLVTHLLRFAVWVEFHQETRSVYVLRSRFQPTRIAALGVIRGFVGPQVAFHDIV